jgi:hypothetical protein
MCLSAVMDDGCRESSFTEVESIFAIAEWGGILNFFKEVSPLMGSLGGLVDPSLGKTVFSSVKWDFLVM